MSALAALAPVSPPRRRVMIVDDSAVVRGLVSRWLQAEPDFELVAIAVDGAQAVKKARETDCDLCVLDVEMPVMSGLDALPLLLEARPRMKVVMCSTLTRQGASVTLRALDLGAAEFVAKPEATRIGGATAFRDELLVKLRGLGRAPVHKPPAPKPAPALLRPAARSPELTVIGCSTGGPPALRVLLSSLGPEWPTPILVVQHMPATFTRILADHLTGACKMPVREARHGEALDRGVVYIAPGDWHMTVRPGPRPVAQLSQSAPENWCRPSVDPLFRSAAAAYGDRVLALVLTGMGHDGREGARELVAKGARVLAQDEASSVVWGMPGAVVEAGLAAEVLPLSDLGAAARRIVGGGR